MPISSPSYFPPSRGTDQIVGITAGTSQTGSRVFLAGQSAGNFTTQSDLVIIGDRALSAGVLGTPNNDVNAQGTTIYGSQAGINLTNFTGVAAPGPALLVGYRAAALATDGRQQTIVGIQAAENMTSVGASFDANTFVGYQVAQKGNTDNTGFAGNVIVGTQACQGSGAAGIQSLLNCVVIGASANKNYPLGGGGSLQNSVIIGGSAALGAFSCNANVLIGANIAPSLTNASDANVVIGSGADISGATSRNVIVGANSARTQMSGEDNVLVGYGTTGTTGDGCVILGSGAALAESGSESHRFIIETFLGITRRAIFYGDLNSGNLISGNSDTPNRDFGGAGSTNILKLLNGTKGASNPIDGGYFYIAAGALHWVGSAGTDTPIAPA